MELNHILESAVGHIVRPAERVTDDLLRERKQMIWVTCVEHPDQKFMMAFSRVLAKKNDCPIEKQ